MKRDYTKYYRQFVPYRFRHGLRMMAYRVMCRVRGDKFVGIESDVFAGKATEIYGEDVNLFYVAPQTNQNGVVSPDKCEPQYIAFVSSLYRLKNVSCYSASDVIKLDDRHYLYEVRDYYRKARKQISSRDGDPVYVEERDYFVLRHYKEAAHLEKGILLSSYFASNYYHFTFQSLAKLRLCGMIDKSVPLLVNEAVAKYPSFQQLLEICNVDKRKVIMLSNGTQYDVDELYYITPQMISVPNYRVGAVKMPDDDLYMCESLDYLHKMMLPHMDKDWVVPERVFLARRYASDRRGYNEEECYNILKQYGFTEVRPETLSLGQQIALFNKAKCIVGATGAAFTNLIYSSADCLYIVLKNARSEDSIFSSLAAFNNAMLIYLCDSSKGTLTDASLEHEDFHIDVNDLKDLIEKIV